MPKSIIAEGPATRQAAPPRRAVVNIDLAQIITRDRLRKLRPDKVDALAESINAQGQLQPIIVQRHGADYLLIHRLQAVRQLKHDTIRAEIAGELDADQALLIEIDENLCRAELSPAERALHIRRRKELYEKAHPETKHGAVGRGGKSSQNENSFVADVGAKTGKGRSTVARDVTRANKVGVLDEIIGTSLDKGSEIDALAKLPQDEQRELADRAKAGEEVTARHDEYADFLNAQEKAHKESAHALAEFTIACRTYLPKMLEADREKARRLVTRMTAGLLAGNEAPTISDSIPDDLSVPAFLQRGAGS